MRNKRFSWKHTFVALAISFVVCLLIVVVMTTATKRDLPEFFLRYLPAEISVPIVLAAAMGFTNMRNLYVHPAPSVSGFDGGDGEFAAVGVSECGENLGYVGAHGGLAQAESFGDDLVRQRLDEQVERGA